MEGRGLETWAPTEARNKVQVVIPYSMSRRRTGQSNFEKFSEFGPAGGKLWGQEEKLPAPEGSPYSTQILQTQLKISQI